MQDVSHRARLICEEQQGEIVRIRQITSCMGIEFTDPDGNENEVYYKEPDAHWREGSWQGAFPWKLEEVTA